MEVACPWKLGFLFCRSSERGPLIYANPLILRTREVLVLNFLLDHGRTLRALPFGDRDIAAICFRWVGWSLPCLGGGLRACCADGTEVNGCLALGPGPRISSWSLQLFLARDAAMTVALGFAALCFAPRQDPELRRRAAKVLPGCALWGSRF